MNSMQFEDESDTPKSGDTIRTKKMQMEGKVESVGTSRAGYPEVLFRVADGRLMKTPVSNVIVVEKLADEDEEIMEVSTETLAKYKTAAAQDASAANKKAWDPNTSGHDADAAITRGNKRFHGVIQATKKQFANDAKNYAQRYTKEGSMNGINRSAPAQDVSYEKILAEVKQEWLKEQNVNELSVDTMKNYQQKVSSPQRARTASFYQLSKDAEGSKRADQKIKTRTGDRTAPKKPQAKKTFEERLAEFVDEAFNPNSFSDILGKQHQEAPPAPKKGDIQKIPSKNKNFQIWYRMQTDTLRPVSWQVRDPSGKQIIHSGTSSNEKDAFNDAEDWIVKSGETAEASKNVTVNFNAAFARQIAPEGETLWIDFWEGPLMVYSKEPQQGYKKTVIRTQEHARTAGAALLPVTTMSPSEANKIGLRADSRYTLGPREELEPGVYGCPLEWHSRVEKGVVIPLKEPSITTSHPEVKIKEVYQGPHTGDPTKLAKSPKSTMRGSEDIPFSELVKDTINKHGVKWAFEYYVKKNGLPPRQFRIFAGI